MPSSPVFIPEMRRIKVIHFIGIGGAGMCGIAEVLLNQGYQVSGSDIQQTQNTKRLSELGATVFIGHSNNNIKNANVVVISSAIKKDNSELLAAQRAQLPIVPRAEMLAELMRYRHGIAVAGTHGKTTTTSLLASIFARANLAPTFIIGGLLNSANTNAQLGNGRYLIAEADESDASFLHLQPMVAVITNIDADHMGAYAGDFSKLKSTFVDFIHNLPFYGLAVVCIDDKNISSLIADFHRPVITYGFDQSADYRLSEYISRGLKTQFLLSHHEAEDPVQICLNTAGMHNALNAAAAFVVAKDEGVETAIILNALENFNGVARRFQVTSNLTLNGQAITLVDDYGHHPTEVEATIKAARESWPDQRLIMVYQPHRYSRTHDLYEDFVRILSKVDSLFLLDVYSAGEDAIAGADSKSLAMSIRQRGEIDPVHIAKNDDLYSLLKSTMESDDILITQGAGDISKVSVDIVRRSGSNETV